MPLKTCHLALAGFVVATLPLQAAPDWKAIEPLLAAKCYECHNAEKHKGEIDLKQFALQSAGRGRVRSVDQGQRHHRQW